MIIYYILIFIVLGFCAGLLSGLLGVSGGIIIVPSLYYVFDWLGFAPENRMHFAIGTSLAAMIIISSVSAWFHHRKGAVLWNYSRIMIPGVIVGCIIGIIISRYTPSDYLARIFGGFLILIAIYFLLPKTPSLHFETLPKLLLMGFGSFIGCASSLLGIGGGVVAVPVLMGFSLPAVNAVAVSASLTFFTAIVGTIGYLIIGFNVQGPAYHLGYIFLPAFFAMGIASVFGGPIGVKLAHFLHAKILKKIFAVVLGLTGLTMIF